MHVQRGRGLRLVPSARYLGRNDYVSYVSFETPGAHTFEWPEYWADAKKALVAIKAGDGGGGGGGGHAGALSTTENAIDFGYGSMTFEEFFDHHSLSRIIGSGDDLTYTLTDDDIVSGDGSNLKVSGGNGSSGSNGIAGQATSVEINGSTYRESGGPRGTGGSGITHDGTDYTAGSDGSNGGNSSGGRRGSRGIRANGNLYAGYGGYGGSGGVRIQEVTDLDVGDEFSISVGRGGGGGAGSDAANTTVYARSPDSTKEWLFGFTGSDSLILHRFSNAGSAIGIISIAPSRPADGLQISSSPFARLRNTTGGTKGDDGFVYIVPIY